MRSITAAAPILATVLLLTSCGDSASENLAEQLAENAVGGDVDIDVDEDGGSMHVESSEGSMDLSFGDELPDGFPSNLTVVDGQILSGTRVEQAEEGTILYSVMIQVDRTDVDALVAEVRQSVTDAGFEITFEQESTIGEQRIVMTQFEGDGFMGSANVLETEDGEVTVQYVISEEMG